MLKIFVSKPTSNGRKEEVAIKIGVGKVEDIAFFCSVEVSHGSFIGGIESEISNGGADVN